MATKSRTKTAGRTTGKTASRSKTGRRPWSKGDMQMVRQGLKSHKAVRVIARQIGRSEGAVRQKLFAEGIFIRPASVSKTKSGGKMRPRAKAKPKASRTPAAVAV